MFRFFLEGDRARALELAQEILSTRPDDLVAASVVAQCGASGSEFDAEILASVNPRKP